MILHVWVSVTLLQEKRHFLENSDCTCFSPQGAQAWKEVELAAKLNWRTACNMPQQTEGFRKLYTYNILCSWRVVWPSFNLEVPLFSFGLLIVSAPFSAGRLLSRLVHAATHPFWYRVPTRLCMAVGIKWSPGIINSESPPIQKDLNLNINK